MKINVDYRDFYRFNNIKRYSNSLNQLYNENNTEHSFMVAVILIKLMSKYKVKSYNLLAFSLLHDASELVTGDINSLAKTQKMRVELKKIDKEFFKIYGTYFGLKSLKKYEYYLLKASDLLSTYFYGKINKRAYIKSEGYRLFKYYLRLFKDAYYKGKK